MWIRQLFRTKKRKRPKYKIDHHPDYGYCALYDDAPDATLKPWWYVINDQLILVTSDHARTIFNDECWVSTEAEAGERINRHATSDGQTTVWTG